MKVLFAVSNESISNSIVKKYGQMYKEIVSGKNVYYFNAILKELQKDKSYDRIVISEDLEPFTNNNFDTIDNFIFDKLDSISDEATNSVGEDIPIILIATDRRNKADSLLVKLFGIGVYSTLLGQDRSIEQVCKLLNKPRTKKEAKVYYQIDSNEVEYKAENESDVSEMEIQNIINHYKRLGKNEDRYAESFNSIASQYTDAQLKLIIKFLPINVKAVLEASSPRYQQLMLSNGSSKKINNTYKEQNINVNRKDNSGIKVESILENVKEKKLNKPVIIPGTVSTKNVKKVEKSSYTPQEFEKENTIEEEIKEDNLNELIEEVSSIKEEPEVTIQPEEKRRRGRPRKITSEEPKDIKQEGENEVVKKRRGRPKKVNSEEVVMEEKEPEVNLFELEDEEENNESTVLPGFEEFDFDEEKDNETENMLPGFEDEADETKEDKIEETEEIVDLPNFNRSENKTSNNVETKIENKKTNGQRRSFYDELIPNPVSVFAQPTENLLTKDKKIVSFVGTSKNGTSFLVNNLAELFSSQGIRTAILDLTKNKNSYYIYTKNEEELRKISFECIKKLTEGKAEGIKVNKSLDVYTCLPGEEEYINNIEPIMQTLVNNYSLVLLDCDFDTEYGYLSKAQEIYLVQSMDILTIQPLTAYLRNLKAKGILTEGKLRVVVNKTLKVRGITEKAIIGGMSCYNDPAMSFMTELFNRETIKYVSMPFDIQAYSRYLEGLVNCVISLNGYSKDFMVALKRLSAMVYPLINSKDKNNYNNYNNFSNSMNATIDKMRNSY